MTFAIILLGFMIPAALIWVLAYLGFRRSRAARCKLFVIVICALAWWWSPASLFILPLALPMALVTLALFEWAATQEAK